MFLDRGGWREGRGTGGGGRRGVEGVGRNRARGRRGRNLPELVDASHVVRESLAVAAPEGAWVRREQEFEAVFHARRPGDDARTEAVGDPLHS